MKLLRGTGQGGQVAGGEGYIQRMGRKEGAVKGSNHKEETRREEEGKGGGGGEREEEEGCREGEGVEKEIIGAEGERLD